MPQDQSDKIAKLYRMVMTDHTCPYGLKSKDLLQRHGFDVEDHHRLRYVINVPAQSLSFCN